METQAGQRPSFRPGNWPGWSSVVLLWLIGRLPVRVALALARPLGALLRGGMRRRRRIAERNIARCFPAYAKAERAALLRGTFRSLARAVFETAWSWTASDRRVRRFARIEGHERVLAELEAGRGVLLLSPHMTCLEIGARLVGMHLPGAGLYRPLRNPVLEWYQTRCRLRYARAMIHQREMRQAVRWLRAGRVLWYAPDQDFGAARSLLVDFFGMPAATLRATHRLARTTGCAVMPLLPQYEAGTRSYRVHIGPRLEGFPGPDEAADLVRINALIEAHVRRVPDQYWWVHRRFKTVPPGAPPFYAGVEP